jgi:hypothetical protein
MTAAFHVRFAADHKAAYKAAYKADHKAAF